MQTNRPARERSARQDREPHCEQTDAIETPSVTDLWQPWLELEAVEAWLETSRVFYNLSLTLNLGQHTAILGPNGSGKSTLVRLIDRSIHPVVKPGSTLKLFGESLPKQWMLRRNIGMVSAELERRVADSIRLRSLVHGGWFGSIGVPYNKSPSQAQQRRVDALLGELELADLAEQPFGTLSDGQRRRALIARALVHAPRVLVLDEPTNGLDLKAKHQLFQSLTRLCRQRTTIVMITHQLDSVIPDIHRVIGLRQGAVVLDGAPQEVLNGPALSHLFATPLQVVRAGGYLQALPLS